MNNDLLNAECVIQHLRNLNVIAACEWRNQHPNDQDYSVLFDNPKHKGDIRIQIVKRANEYYIPRSLVGILSYRHYFNADAIFNECSIAA